MQYLLKPVFGTVFRMTDESRKNLYSHQWISGYLWAGRSFLRRFSKVFSHKLYIKFSPQEDSQKWKKPPASIRSLQALIGFLRHWKRVFTRDTVPLKWKLQRISVLQASPILFTARKWYIRKKEISSWPYYALVKGLIIHTWANNTCTFSTMIF